MPVPPVVWDDEDVVSTMKWLIGEKQSASAVAQMLSVSFGVEVTRNMVIGKARRMGVKLNPVARTGGGWKENTPRQEKPVGPGKIAKIRQARNGLRRHAEVSNMSIPALGMTTLLERRPNQCPFPYGDPRDTSFSMCGGEKTPGAPYCSAHMKIAYRPWVERKAKQERAAA